ncbi:CRISPR-associated helicase Cas3' [Aquibaculum sediminis]|uniref:CRISPR-associated helicase Cas3' n=1 Tax=Aquibaculum sediminis TaxID=3231907 RepID=UPI0034512874
MLSSAQTLFAHSLAGADCQHWERLEDHLKEVAEFAAVRAATFDARDSAWAAGLLHDLGKAKPAFQAKLYGEKNGEPHSAEGALYASDKLGKWGWLLAYCIAGHHTGLPNGLSGEAPGLPLEERLQTASRLELPEGIPTPSPPPWPPDQLRGAREKADIHFRLQFLIRMLFSALVDGDFIATEAFYDKAEGRNERERDWRGRLEDLRESLDGRFSALEGRPGAVNEQRRAILKHVRDHAPMAPGLFSLNVPTGGGKTLASLAFALDHALIHGLRRVIYVIPYTSIVEQTAAVFREALGDDDAILEHHSSFDWDGLTDHSESERLRLATQNWNRPVIVTTAVQFLESLYANRPSHCRKLHNIAQSVVVLDEAQTLPLRLLRPSLRAVSELARGYGASVVLCTATQPAFRSEDGFGEAALEDVRELAPDPPSLHATLRRVRVQDVGVMDDVALAERLRAAEQTLMIVNTRAHARSLFEAIHDMPGAAHLTTSMTAAHRRAVLGDIRGRLKRNAPVRLVATSLIEAGVDVDFPQVWRALAGIDSIAQAAGRCNREGMLEGMGEVFVFRPAEHKLPRDLAKFAEEAGHVLERFDDPLSLEAVNAYFRDVYWSLDQGLDAIEIGDTRGILTAIAKAGNAMQYPFADIALKFQLINEGGLPVIIVGGDWGIAPDELERLRFRTTGVIARALQAYQVQVPRKVRARMLAKGAVEFWHEQEFGPQFALLANNSLYDARAGLRWDNFTDLGFLET